MFGEFIKRLVNGVVLLLAAIAFFLVPVGKKTLAQHMVAIFTTKPAREAAAALSETARKLASTAMAEVEEAKKKGLIPSDLQKTAPR